MKEKQILSIDTGTNSIGWTVTKEDLTGKLIKFIDGGSYIFTSPTDAKTGNFLNQKRTEKRGERRNSYRSKRRMEKLENFLINNNLLEEKINNREIQEYIGNPYELRAKALDTPLTNEELGWSIMHLAKRRGFLSSSKSLTAEEKEEQARADELSLSFKKYNVRTLGELFFKRFNQKEKIRKEALKRQLVQDELLLILQNQKNYHKQITKEFEKELNHIIFNQRPLKIQKRISLCKFESNGKIKKHTSAKYHPLSQEFILRGFINNLKYRKNGKLVFLSEQQKSITFNLLWQNKEITYKKLISSLELNSNTFFNFQKNKSDKIKGNQNLNYLKKKSKEFFNSLTKDEQIDLMIDIATIKDHTGEALINRITNHWTKEPDIISDLIISSDKLPAGYTSLSLKSIKKILPFLEKGIPYFEAEKLAYPKFYKNIKQINKLPPIEGITNTVVLKSCSQVRHLVNTLIDKYGNFDIIKIELARDLTQSQAKKSLSIKKQKENEKLNEEAKKYLIKNNIKISANNLTKYKLYQEGCNKNGVLKSIYPKQEVSGNWFFPTISLNKLFNANAEFEIEHIIPKSISGDDSFLNKSLCPQKINQDKGQRTPYDYYYSKGGQELINKIAKVAYSQIGSFKSQKFLISQEKYLEENLINTRYLNDTRYLSLFLKEYLQQICKEVITTKGGFTAIMRNVLDFNSLLGNEFKKNRSDHRHHMVDAFCISTISPKSLNLLEKIRKSENKKDSIFMKAERELRSFIYNVELDFIEHFNNVIVAHEVENTLKGEIEKETIYGHDLIKLENGKTLEKFFVHKQFIDVVKGKKAKDLLELHENYKISLSNKLKLYLEENNKIPENQKEIDSFKRIKCYYNDVAKKNTDGNIEGFRTIRDNENNITGYKKTADKAYTVVYEDFSNKAITKMEQISTKPKFNNQFCKLFRGDLLENNNGEVFKIYQLPKDQVAIHPVNSLKIEGRDAKKNKELKQNAKIKSIKSLFEKEGYKKIKVNILGHKI
jgi:CRISPR-associated endonuclease Csn1